MILGASGKPMVRIGGQAAFRSFWKGDIAVSLQWFTDEDQYLDEEPSMFIVAPKRTGSNPPVFIIPLRDLNQFVTPMGNYDGMVGMRKALEICGHLQLDPTSRSTVTAIADILYETLPELLKMPPKPEGMRLNGDAEKPGTTVSLIADGKVVIEKQVMQ